ASNSQENALNSVSVFSSKNVLSEAFFPHFSPINQPPESFQQQVVSNIQSIVEKQEAFHEQAEINKPVKWVRKIVLKNKPSSSINIEVPDDVSNIEIMPVQSSSGNGILSQPSYSVVEEEFLPQSEKPVLDPVQEVNARDDKVLVLDAPQQNIEISYVTSGPQAKERIIDGKKALVISSDLNYKNVKSYMYFNELAKPRLFHKEIGKDITYDPVYNVTFYDTNNNGLYDYVEWTVPHLSTQTFIVSNESDFAKGNTVSNTTEFVRFELDDNQKSMDFDVVDMTGNVLLMHLNDKVEDSSGNGHHGIAQNGAYTLADSGGPALDREGVFDGVDDYIIIPDSDDWAFGNNDFTIAVWVKFNSVVTPSIQGLISDWEAAGGSNRAWELWKRSSNEIRFQAWDSSGSILISLTSSTPVTSGKWYHVVVQRNGTISRLFLDGVVESTDSTAGGVISNSQSPLLISGEWKTGFTSVQYIVNGLLDEIVIYNRSLSDSEIALLYNEGVGYKHTGNENGLVGVWHMDESSWQIQDTSGNGNNGTSYNGTLYDANGKLNSGLSFDGVDDYVESPITGLSASPQETSISFWLKGNSWSVSDTPLTVINSGDTSDKGDIIFRYTAANTFTLYVGQDGSNSWDQIDFTSFPADFAWHFISATYSKGNIIKLYFDGVEVGSTASTLFPSTLSKLRIGTADDLTGSSYYFNGTIDEVAIWNRSLSAEEVKAIYESGIGRVQLQDDDNVQELPNNQQVETFFGGLNMTGNVLLLHLNDKVEDDSGNAYHEIAQNGADTQADSGGPALDREGLFDGVDDYVVVDDSAEWAFGINNFTISFWAKINSFNVLDNSETFISQYDVNNPPKSDNGWFLRFLNYKNNTQFGFSTVAGFDENVINFNWTPQLGVWYHHVIVRNGSRIYWFVNGTALPNASSNVIGTSSIFDSPKMLSFARTYINSDTPNGQELNGSLDEIAIYNRALTPTEIAHLYNDGSGYRHVGNENGLVALWHMDESSWQIQDTSGNNNHGNATNGVLFSSDAKLNSGLKFDGVDDYIQLPALNQSITQDFTISSWVYPLSTTGEKYLLTAGDDTGPSLAGIGIRINDGVLTGVLTTGADVRTKPTFNGMATNEWQHVAITYDGSVAKLFLNGLVVNNTTPSTGGVIDWSADAVDYLIGESALHTSQWNGTLDEVSVWNRSLSAEEIQEIYKRQKGKYFHKGTYTSEVFNASGSALWNELIWTSNAYGDLPNNQQTETTFIRENFNMTGNVLLMHLNNDSSFGENGTHFFDFSGNGNNGSCTATGCPSFISAGKIKGAFDFDGADDKITIPDSPSLDVSEITMSFWYRPRDTDVSHTVTDMILSKDTGSNPNRAYYIGYYNDVQGERFQVAMFTGAGTRCYGGGLFTGNVSLSDNEWVHFTFTYNGTTCKWYKNGEKIDEYSYGSYSAIVNANAPLKIGTNSADAQWVNGTLDEVAIWNMSLSEEEVKEVYKRGAIKLNLSIRSCDDPNCNGDSWVDLDDTSPQSLSSLQQNQYTQFMFALEDSGLSNETFTPELYTANLTTASNSPPTINSVVLNATSIFNSTIDNLTGFVYGLNDIDGDNITLVYTWYKFNKTFGATVFINDSKLIGYWPLNNDSLDYAGGNDGTPIGAPKNNFSGKVGGSYDFNGTNFIDGGLDNWDQDNQPFTVSVWMKTTDLTGSKILISKGDWNSLSSGWRLWTTNGIGSSLEFSLDTTAASSGDVSTPAVSGLDDGQWHHLAAGWNTTHIYFYVDGNLTGTTIANSFFATSVENFVIGSGEQSGSLDPTLAFSGSIDEVQFYNRTLTEEEILQLYRGSKHGGNVFGNEFTSVGDNFTLGVTPVDFLSVGNQVN
ncbi:MAG: LamG domain-containing protein, partial [Aquificota bacterium]